MNFQDFHQQSQEYTLSRIRDKIKGNKHREQLYLQGNTQPKWEPQGSFNRMSYGVSGEKYNGINSTMSGGSRSQLQQQAVQQQLLNRAKQLIQMSGAQEINNLPGATQRQQTPRATEKDELELFFSDLSSLNFTGSKIPMKEIKEAIKNLRLSGLGLNINTLIRFKDIAEDAINLFIQNIQQNKNLDFKKAFDFYPASEEPEIYNYIQNLQTLPAFELIYKIYLILVSLINNFNLQLQDRKQIFTQHYEEVLKARPNTLFDGDTKTAYDIAAEQVKELKEIMPTNFYQAIFKKQGTSVKDLIKLKPKEEEDEDEIIEVDLDDDKVDIEAVGEAEEKQGNELDDLQGLEVESGDLESDDESVATSNKSDDFMQPGGQAAPEMTQAEQTKIKRQVYNNTKKIINTMISQLDFPMSETNIQTEGDIILKQALQLYGQSLEQEGINIDEKESGKKVQQISKLIFPVIERKNNQESKSRKSSKKTKKGKGWFSPQNIARGILEGLLV